MRFFTLTLTAALLALTAFGVEPPPLRVLVVTGDHPYDADAFNELWRDRPGIDFTQVELIDKGEIFDDTSSWDYDAMVLYNMSAPMSDNPGVAQARYENFAGLLERGVGLIPMHHGLLTYTEWPRTKEIYGLNIGETGPYAFHMGQEYAVEIADPTHPITRGMKDFEVLDETYTHFYGTPKEDNRVLLKTSHEPSDKQLAWVREYANARVFAIQLGHDAHVFLHPSFQEVMMRGLRWVTGRLPEDAAPEAGSRFRKYNDGYALRAIPGYEFGHAKTALHMLALQVDAAKADPGAAAKLASEMAELLGGVATDEGRRFVISELGRLGPVEAVPTLEPLLRDAAWCDDARMALERVGGDYAKRALRDALYAAPTACRIGIAQSLGALNDPQAVPALATLAAEEGELGMAAARALGRIRDEGALDALHRLADAGKAGPHVYDALVNQANALRTGGQTAAACRAYETCASEAAPARIQAAALIGLTHIDGDARRVMEALASRDPLKQEAGLEALRYAPGQEAIEAAAGLLTALDAGMQRRLLARLAERGAKAALPAVEALAANEPEPVRAAALRALARLGGAGQVELLAQAAQSEAEAIRSAATYALARMPGCETGAALLGMLETASPESRAVAAGSLADRKRFDAVDALMAQTGSQHAIVRQASYASLGRLVREEDMPAFAQRVAGLTSDVDLAWAEEAMEEAAERAYDPQRLAAATATALDEATPEARLVLLRYLGELPSPAALAALMQAARNADAAAQETAVKALGRWPTSEPRNALLAIARKASAAKVRQAALSGYVRLAGESADVTGAGKAAMLEQALALAETDNAKRDALDALGELQSIRAMRIALPYLKAAATQQAALDALVSAASHVALDYPEEVAGLLEEAQASASTEAQRVKVAELRASIDAFLETLKVQWNFNEGLNGWGGANDCELRASDGNLVAEITGDDPHFAVTCDVPGGLVLVKMRARSSVTGFAQLFWSTDKTGRFGAPGMIATFETQASEGEWKEYEIPIPVDGDMTALRLDPAGMGEGDIEIDWIRLFASESAE